MNQDGPIASNAPQRPSRVLIVEDNPGDVELVVRELKKARFDTETDHVSSESDFVERIRAEAYDLIIADYDLRGWTAIDAFERLKEAEVETPFVLLTGVLGNAAAAECLKKGVWDYVLKDHLAGLPLVVRRVWEEKRRRDERRSAELVLRESEARFRMLADAISTAIFIYEGSQCRYTNPAAENVTGYGSEELRTKNFLDLVHPEWRDVAIDKEMQWFSREELLNRQEIKILQKRGESRWLDITIGTIELEGRRARLITAIDITERKQMEEEIRELAFIDPLTGLGNYRRILDVMGREIERSRRTGRSFALVLFDLDDLKKINDSCGHLTGSRALCRLANILRVWSRAVDTSIRFGGDEFALLMPETDREGARSAAERIADQIRSDGESPPISASFGIAVFPKDGETIEEVFKSADQFLYKMKAT